jgi:hypothetical protein
MVCQLWQYVRDQLSDLQYDVVIQNRRFMQSSLALEPCASWLAVRGPECLREVLGDR